MSEDIFTFSLPLTNMLLLGWLITFVIYIVFSLIFVYHWRAFAANAVVVRRSFLLYFTGTGLALVSALVAIFTI